ncbi:hypothetical protein BDN72DRAFT_284186 [Pluteus cervinus]|uniref:Uncharacterized protein n=1 Tax=Pluteus cervinus TaxID=181527 RepID=A0ACD3B4Y3_9AGAR|nr:hypothetical protein BDN72DRAFT_284186 [Pluteus cervinus]
MRDSSRPKNAIRDELGQWLFSEPQIVQSDSVVTWDAAKRGAPPTMRSSAILDTQKSLAIWSEDPHAGAVRRISGRAGTGKTTIAHRMAQYWARQGRLAASFFFSRDGEEPYTASAQFLPGAIAYQLLSTYNMTFPEVDKATIHSRSPSFSWSDLVDGLSSIRFGLPPSIIVIDGLDECHCPDEETKLLKDILTSARQLGPALKFLISCRPESHLESVFDEFAEELGPSYHIQLSQSFQNNEGVDTLLPVSEGALALDLCLEQYVDLLPLPASTLIPISMRDQSSLDPEITNVLFNYPFTHERYTCREWYESDSAHRDGATWRAVKSSYRAADQLLSDTRQDLQCYLAAWPDNPSAGSVRWISGLPGTGKTTFARIMAERWECENYLAASFFFSRSREGMNTTLRFCDTILKQLNRDPRFTPLIRDKLAIPWKPPPSVFWLKIADTLQDILPLSEPVVVIVDGLDECHSRDEQVELLRALLISTRQLGPSFRFLICSRPEHHIAQVFQEFNLPDSDYITLGESTGDNDDIRTFLQRSLEKVSVDRCRYGTISITDGSWPSSEMVEELVRRANGQFSFAASVMAFVDDQGEDPVRMLHWILDRKVLSFEAMDKVYLPILEKVDQEFEGKSPQLCQLMCDLLLHVNSQPSSSHDVAEFWFTNKEAIDDLVKRLHLVLIQRENDLIDFRYDSFRDFISSPSLPSRFSLPGMNPVSKIFFFLRNSAMIPRSSSGPGRVDGSRGLGHTSLTEEARRLHEKYIHNRLTFPDCRCSSNLQGITSLPALRTFKQCVRNGCVISTSVVTSSGYAEWCPNLPLNENGVSG